MAFVNYSEAEKELHEQRNTRNQRGGLLPDPDQDDADLPYIDHAGSEQIYAEEEILRWTVESPLCAVLRNGDRIPVVYDPTVKRIIGPDQDDADLAGYVRGYYTRMRYRDMSGIIRRNRDRRLHEAMIAPTGETVLISEGVRRTYSIKSRDVQEALFSFLFAADPEEVKTYRSIYDRRVKGAALSVKRAAGKIVISFVFEEKMQ